MDKLHVLGNIQEDARFRVIQQREKRVFMNNTFLSQYINSPRTFDTCIKKSVVL